MKECTNLKRLEVDTQEAEQEVRYGMMLMSHGLKELHGDIDALLKKQRRKTKYDATSAVLLDALRKTHP